MACLDELNQAADKSWIGISRATGDMQKFENIAQFNDYQKALGCAPVRGSPYVESNAGQNTYHTGFLEFKPRDKATQARFDALSDQWEGAKASDAAVKQGLYYEDSAEPAAIREKKPQPSVLPPPTPAPAPTNDVCSIQ
jgi:hypothetical protein